MEPGGEAGPTCRILSILLYRPHSEDIRFVELGKERDK